MYIHPLVPYTDARDVSLSSGCIWLLLLLLLLLLLSVDLSVFSVASDVISVPPPASLVSSCGAVERRVLDGEEGADVDGADTAFGGEEEDDVEGTSIGFCEPRIGLGSAPTRRPVTVPHLQYFWSQSSSSQRTASICSSDSPSSCRSSWHRPSLIASAVTTCS